MIYCLYIAGWALLAVHRWLCCTVCTSLVVLYFLYIAGCALLFCMVVPYWFALLICLSGLSCWFSFTGVPYWLCFTETYI